MKYRVKITGLLEVEIREGETAHPKELAIVAAADADWNRMEDVSFTADEGPRELVIPLKNGGALVAYDKQSGDYPGAGIQYRCPNGLEMDVVLVEGDGPDEDAYDPDKLRVYVYGDPHSDDYTNKYEVSRMELEAYDVN